MAGDFEVDGASFFLGFEALFVYAENIMEKSTRLGFDALTDAEQKFKSSLKRIGGLHDRFFLISCRKRTRPRKNWSLLQLLVEMHATASSSRRRTHSKLRKDKVYALLGLAKDSFSLGITPNYNDKDVVAFTKIQKCFRNRGHIWALNFCQPDNKTNTPGLPSWVVDWSSAFKNSLAVPPDLVVLLRLKRCTAESESQTIVRILLAGGMACVVADWKPVTNLERSLPSHAYHLKFGKRYGDMLLAIRSTL